MNCNNRIYVQCQLNKRHLWQVAWIPEQHAVVGNVLMLREGERRFPGWRVDACGARASAEVILARSRAEEQARRALDILSEPITRTR